MKTPLQSFVLDLLIAMVLVGTSCTPGSPDLGPVDRLVDQGQHESAWKALDGLKPQDDRVLARRIRLCLEGYTISLNHALFSLKDLGPGETLEGLRQAGGTFTLHPLDVPAAVAEWQAHHPRSALLDRTLGDFYDQVSRLYSSFGDLDGPRLLEAGRKAYAAAWTAGPFSGPSGDAYAVILLRLGAWKDAAGVLAHLVAQKGEVHPDARYNRALALFQDKDLAGAGPAAEEAIQSYAGNPGAQTDAVLLASDIAQAQGKTEAALALLDRAPVPAHPEVLLRRMRLEVAKDDPVAARTAALAYANLDAGDPTALQNIIQTLGPSAPVDLETVFGEAAEAWGDRPGARGNLEALWAHWLIDGGRKAEARGLLDRAEADFRRQGGVTPEARRYLADLRSRL